MTRVNELIREREVRLIDASGEHSGVISIEEALKLAADADLDLVEVSAKSKPHVCRIMDYGHYKYELAKKQKEAKKKQKLIIVKEIKLRPRIDQHDYDFKMNHAKKFLEHDDKVKFILQFRGRENAHKELGRVVLDRVINDLESHGIIEQSPRTEGRFMNMIIAPLTVIQKKKIEKDNKKKELEALSVSDAKTPLPEKPGDTVPAVEAPAVTAPAVAAPAVEAPAVAAPAVAAPVVEAPAVAAPAVAAPVVEAPVVEAPKVDTKPVTADITPTGETGKDISSDKE
jgi:translation initiation factor IF-3